MSAGVNWEQVAREDFRQGLMRKLKQEAINPEMGPTYDGVLLAGEIVQTHMEELPDYFTRLEKLKAEVDEYGSGAGNGTRRQRKHVSFSNDP